MTLVDELNVSTELARRAFSRAIVRDFHFRNGLIRVVKEHNLVEIAVSVPERIFIALANYTSSMNVERPPERIIFRGDKFNLNIFIDEGE